MYSASHAFLDTLARAGVDCIFANFGSDHPALIEALAERAAENQPGPRVITCPTEMVALSAAHGHTLVSGRAQAVIVHVECGTQSLAGALHNADKGRAPVLIYAGASPLTQHGELPGSRNEFIHWIQDVHDQRGIVRGYTRYDYELRSSANVAEIVQRALRFAHSDPQGPVYLCGAREIMEATSSSIQNRLAAPPVLAGALPASAAHHIAGALAAARRPIIVTSHLGRDAAAVAELGQLCTHYGIGVVQSVPTCVNLSSACEMHLGSWWNEPHCNPDLADADVVVAIETDVPWIPSVNGPAPTARIFQIDKDPLKQGMPLWDLPIEQSYRANPTDALRQIASALDTIAPAVIHERERHSHYARRHRALKAERAANRPGLTAAHIATALRLRMASDAIVLSESITNYGPIFDHLELTEAGSYFASGGGSLGWNGGAAIGAKLAAPDREIITICGDGSYIFSAPSTVHWMARRYGLPFLQIVLDNDGWRAPRASTAAVHPNGYASRGDELGLSFSPSPDYGGIAAAAGGAWTGRVDRLEMLDEAMAAAFAVVRYEKRCAVLAIAIAP